MESTAHQMDSLDWNQPDAQGHWPVLEVAMFQKHSCTLKELEQEYFTAQEDLPFSKNSSYYLKEFVGRPTPLYFGRTPDTTSGRCKNLSQARRSVCTPVRTRSTTRWARYYWPSAWAKSALSRKQEPDSMEWPPLRWRRCLGWSASSTWVKSIASDRRSTFFG